MIRIPKEISKIMRTLEEGGHSVYAVGGCVRDSLLGEKPLDWDLATSADLETMKRLFPDATVLSGEYHVIRLDYSRGDEDDAGVIADIARYRKEGTYPDGRRPGSVEFVDTVEEDLGRRDFTINAIAINPSRSVVDPFGGRDDLSARQICSVGDPEVRFAENPIRMLRAIRLAAECGFTLHQTVVSAISKLAPELQKAGPDRIREEFLRIIVAPNAGKGLRLLEKSGLMAAIVGKDALRLGNRQISEFETLCDNIDKTQPVVERRLGLFYIIFGKKKGLEAMERLNFNNKTRQHLTDALTLLEDLYFLRTFVTLKGFLAKVGMERYEYLHNLSKAQRLVYGYSEHRILVRYELMKEIKTSGHPIFIEDLAVNGDDLLAEGIAQGEKIGQILLMLTDLVHRSPKLNTRDQLLSHARKYAKNPIAAKTRNVRWIK